MIFLSIPPHCQSDTGFAAMIVDRGVTFWRIKCDTPGMCCLDSYSHNLAAEYSIATNVPDIQQPNFLIWGHFKSAIKLFHPLPYDARAWMVIIFELQACYSIRTSESTIGSCGCVDFPNVPKRCIGLIASKIRNSY